MLLITDMKYWLLRFKGLAINKIILYYIKYEETAIV